MFFNDQGEIETLNPRAEEMFGYKESDIKGQKIEILLPNERRGSHVQSRNNYIKKPAVRSMGAGLDLAGLKKDGSTFPVEISLSYLKHENQTLVVAFITDITRRKTHERELEEQRAKLEQYNAQLETKVKGRTRELEHLNMGLQSQIQERKLAEGALKKSLKEVKRVEKEILEALEKEKELSELKSRFVSMASHEFRTPLTTIASSASLIKKYPETDQQPQREKHITRIGNNVKNLTGILNDFLSMEKLESGAVIVKKSTVNLPEILDETIEEMNLILKKKQSIRSSCKKGIVLESDPHLLKNLLYNLLSNASKYSDEEDVILVNVHELRKKIQIEVIDQGIGIPKAEQKNLFTRFFRAGNVTNIQGTGLGLHIVKKYADLMDGEVSFKSKEGKGSTFLIDIPMETK